MCVCLPHLSPNVDKCVLNIHETLTGNTVVQPIVKWEMLRFVF